jgi:sulfate adenylyltransferase subunit 2
MLHLARKAFFPAKPPFPLLHIDTTWKFRAMYEMRERMAKESGMELLVYQNPEAKQRGINPFDHGSLHTDLWKTEGLKQALDLHGFDAAFGGARRDEEKSRAKERIFSFRSANHRWDPKNQRPERDGLILMVDDERFRLRPGETPVMRSVRFRTLGCYPLSGGVESHARTLPEVIQEMLLTTTSERQGRAIDHDQAASMEKKKQEGYF